LLVVGFKDEPGLNAGERISPRGGANRIGSQN
jgi:hypothetical protein